MHRAHLLSRFVAVPLFLFTLPHAVAADPLVLRNGSYLEGAAFIRQGTLVADTFYATWDDGLVLSSSGTDSFADGLSLAAAGAQIALNSDLMTTIDPARFSGVGGASGSITVGTTLDPGAFMNGLAGSQLVIEFTLSEPHAFSFTGHYFAGPDHVNAPPDLFSHSMSAVVYRLIELGPNLTAAEHYVNDQIANEQQTQYSGILDPGRYFLQARAGVRLTTPNTTDGSGFEVDLSLTPVPEPATLLFVGTGLAGVLGYRRRKGRAESASGS